MPGIIFFPFVLVIIAGLSFMVYKFKGKNSKIHHISKAVLLLFVVALALLAYWLYQFTHNYSF